MRRSQQLLPLSFSLFVRLSSAAGVHQPASVGQVSDGSACRLPTVDGVYLTEGFEDATYKAQSGCATSVGTLNAAMIFVDFPDAVANDTAQTAHDVFLPQAHDFYMSMSYGRLNLSVTADTSRYYRMGARSDSYNWARGLTAETHQKYIQDALDAYAKGGGAPLPPVEVLYVIATVKATAISFSPTYMEEVTFRNGTKVAKKCVTIGEDAYATFRFKVINHETGHTMCLPDLYPQTGANGEYVGGFDMMGWILGPDPEYFAWEKWHLGWIDDSQVDCLTTAGTTTHTLTPLETPGGPNDTKAVVLQRNATTALVAEGRFRLGEDSATCGPGVLLYTVATDVATLEGPIRVFDSNPRSGGCDGDEKNDSALSLNKTASYTVPGWGVKVTVTSQNASAYVIDVVVPTGVLS